MDEVKSPAMLRKIQNLFIINWKVFTSLVMEKDPNRKMEYKLELMVLAVSGFFIWIMPTMIGPSAQNKLLIKQTMAMS